MVDQPLLLLPPAQRDRRAATPSRRPSIFSRIWRELESFGARRAAREMRLFSHRWRPVETDLAGRQSSATLEAAEVRLIADRHQATDRGFAADLYAAADRHERLAELADQPAVKA